MGCSQHHMTISEEMTSTLTGFPTFCRWLRYGVTPALAYFLTSDDNPLSPVCRAFLRAVPFNLLDRSPAR